MQIIILFLSCIKLQHSYITIRTTNYLLPTTNFPHLSLLPITPNTYFSLSSLLAPHLSLLPTAYSYYLLFSLLTPCSSPLITTYYRLPTFLTSYLSLLLYIFSIFPCSTQPIPPLDNFISVQFPNVLFMDTLAPSCN